MVNLLPKPVRRKLTYGYYVRLLATFFLSLAFVVGIGAGLLLPSYYLARNESDASARYLEALEGTADIKNRGQIGRTVARFVEQIALLKRYDNEPVTAKMLAAVEAHLSKEVLVNAVQIDYDDSHSAIITLSGVAENRTALLSFAQELKGESVFAGVSVPVNQLAGDSDLLFSLEFNFMAKKP